MLLCNLVDHFDICQLHPAPTHFSTFYVLHPLPGTVLFPLSSEKTPHPSGPREIAYLPFPACLTLCHNALFVVLSSALDHVAHGNRD